MRKFTIFILLISNFFLSSEPGFAQQADVALLSKMNQALPGVRPVSVFVTETAIPISLAVPVGMALYGLIDQDQEVLRNAFYVAFASGINLGLTEGLKRTIRRERPANANLDVPLYVYGPRTDFAMPSGHTSGSFATATAVSLKYPSWYVVVPAYVWASSVGLSRIHMGLHYPTDVLAGAFLGAGSAYLSYKLNAWLWKTYDRKKGRSVRK